MSMCNVNNSTFRYRSPELLVGDTSYGAPVDVWAVGKKNRFFYAQTS